MNHGTAAPTSLTDPVTYLLLAGSGLGGAVLRIIIHRALDPETGTLRVWLAELSGALALGILVGMPVDFTAALSPMSWALLGGSLSSYSAASALIPLTRPRPSPASAIGHLTAAAAVGAAGIALASAARRLIG